jgi:hypothetical protein
VGCRRNTHQPVLAAARRLGEASIILPVTGVVAPGSFHWFSCFLAAQVAKPPGRLTIQEGPHVAKPFRVPSETDPKNNHHPQPRR